MSLKAVQGRVLSTTLITDILSRWPRRRTSDCLHHLKRCLLYGHRREGAQGPGFLPVVNIIQGQGNVFMILFDVLVQFKNAVEYWRIRTIGTRIDFYDWFFWSPEHWRPKSGATEVAVDLPYMLFKGRVSEEPHVAMGTEKSVAVLSRRVGKSVRTSDVFLKGVEVIDNFGAEVALVDDGRHGRNDQTWVLSFVHLLKMFIEVIEGGQHLQAILTNVGLLWLI